MPEVVVQAPANAIVQLLDKVIATYVQAFLALLAVGDQLNTNIATAAGIAAIPAAFTVLANGLPATVVGLPFWVDVLYRFGRTYVVGFAGLLVAVPMFTLDVGILQAALFGALPAAFAVVKALVAQHLGQKGTAALVPARYDLTAAA